MVLAQLGGSIARALARMKGATVVDEKVLADCLNELSRALLQADVRFETVQDSRASSTSTRSPRAPTSAASYTRCVTYIPDRERSLASPKSLIRPGANI